MKVSCGQEPLGGGSCNSQLIMHQMSHLCGFFIYSRTLSGKSYTTSLIFFFEEWEKFPHRQAMGPPFPEEYNPLRTFEN